MSNRYWFDTEFIEDGKTIDLLSIGIVSEDGRSYYAEPAECDLSRASPWVRENVLPHMTGIKTPRAQIAREIVEFAALCINHTYRPYQWFSTPSRGGA